MKLKKILIVGGIAFFIILCSAYFILTSAGFQTSIANSFLKKSFPNSKIEYVKITPTKLCVKGLKIDEISANKNFSVESINGDISIWGILFKDIDLKNFNLKNAIFTFNKPHKSVKSDSVKSSAKTDSKLDNKNISSSETKTSKAMESEKKDSTSFPNFNINIKNFDANLLVILEDGSLINSKLKIDTFESKKIVEISSLDTELECEFNIIDKVKDKLTLKATLVPDKNHFAFKSILEKAEKKLVQIAATIDSSYKNIDGKIQVTSDSSDFKNILKNTPFFDANLLCDIRLSSDLKDVGLNSSFKFLAKDLSLLSESLSPIKDISLSGEISANKRNDEISLANAQALASINGTQILQLKNAKSFKFKTENISEIPDGELVALNILNIPNSLINPFLKGMEFDSSQISTQILISKLNSKFEIKTVDALKISNASLYSKEQTFFKNLNFSLLANSKFNSETADASADLKIDSKDIKDSLNAKFFASKILFEKKSAELALSIKGSILQFLPDNFKKQLEPKIDADFALTVDKKLAELKSAKIDLFLKDNKKIFELKSENKIDFDLNSKKLASKNLAVSISAIKFPFEILSPYAQGADAKSLDLTLKVTANDEHNINANADIYLENVSFKKDSEILFSNLSPKANLKVKLVNDDLKIELTDFEIKSQNVPILNASANANANLKLAGFIKNAQAKVTSTLPKLLSQPALQKFDNASSGMLELDAIYDQNIAKVKLNLHNLTPRAFSETLAKLEVESDLKFEKNALKQLNTIIKTNGTKGESYAALDVKISDIIRAVLNAKTIYIDEFEILAKAFTKPSLENQAQKTVLEGENPNAKKAIIRPNAVKSNSEKSQINLAKNEIDKKAVWDFSKSLNLKCDIEKIVFKSEDIAQNLAFTFSLTPTEIKLSNLKSLIYGANLNAQSLFTFTQNKGYELSDTKILLSDLDIGKFQQPNDAGDILIVGKFNAEADLKALSPNLKVLAQNLLADAKLYSNGGTLTLMDKSSLAGVATNVGSLALKITGNLLGDRVKELPAMGQLFDLLQKLDYSKILVKVKREKDLDIQLSDCTVQTNDFLIKANGKISYDEALQFNQNKIYLPVNIYAKKGDVAELLRKCGFTTTDSSIEGYVNGPKFEVSGTLASPQNNLKEIILESSKRAIGNAGNSTAKGIESGLDALGGLLNNLKKR